jgi:hypothetical protein
MTTTYETIVANVKGAIVDTDKVKGKWANVGKDVAAFFGNEAELRKVKTQFCADAIIPAMRKDLREALSAEIPRKGTDQYEAAPDTWEALKKTRKDATATRDTLFANVIKYAWPAEKVAPSPKELDQFLREHLEACRNKLAKVESAEFDIPSMMRHLEAALHIIN